MEAVRGRAALTPAPYHGLWALLRTSADMDGAAARAAIRVSGVAINPVNRAYGGYAEAIALGRAGRTQEAETAVACADADLAGSAWFRHYGHRVLAEAAIADGWGDPATWLREARACFEEHGQDWLRPRPAARSCGAWAPRTPRAAHTAVCPRPSVPCASPAGRWRSSPS